MAEERDAPSWSQRDDRQSQQAYARANARSRRLRHNPTPSEAKLWKALRRLNREGAHFRRQPAIGRWVYDFGDLSARLLIEVDGGVHHCFPDIALRDAEKETWAVTQGFRLLRFANEQVRGDIDTVIATVREVMSDPHPLPPPHKGEGKDGQVTS